MSADNWTDCPKCLEGENKFREDWEIGLYNGSFDIDYRGQCQQCKFKIEFKHSEEVKNTLRESFRSCPKCGGISIATERRPDGDSICQECKYKGKTSLFDS